MSPRRRHFRSCRSTGPRSRSLRRFDADRLGWLDRATALGPVVAMRMGPHAHVGDHRSRGRARTMLVTDAAAWTRPPATVVPIRLAIGENLFTQADKAWAVLQPEVAPSLRKRGARRAAGRPRRG